MSYFQKVGFGLPLAYASGLSGALNDLSAAAGFHTEPAALNEAEHLSRTSITSYEWPSKRLLSSV